MCEGASEDLLEAGKGFDMGHMTESFHGEEFAFFEHLDDFWTEQIVTSQFVSDAWFFPVSSWTCAISISEDQDGGLCDVVELCDHRV